ncbi:hypothetical protein TNIN_215421 [Trichonephila inaurata madagascariensis]|uniref:C2H2-type domain-containing protein n=1 Tax=Trichonephila inaurata madagascariensis TaxID=2747483 RepID=A0A8X6KB31_9ARAC|nr:hypothetical protein TNIN_215421 [Trichonephila inaurata madagascariensis]
MGKHLVASCYHMALLVASTSFYCLCSLKFKLFSQTPSSTPRSHSRGSPIASRTRHQPSFELALKIGLCKICNKRFPSLLSLWEHLLSVHTPSTKRDAAFSAFPVDFQMLQIREQAEQFRTSLLPANIHLLESQSPDTSHSTPICLPTFLHVDSNVTKPPPGSLPSPAHAWDES